MQHTLFLRVGGALHGKDAHAGVKGHAQARRALGKTDGVLAAQGFGIVQDFHLEFVVESLLCCGIDGRRKKNPQSCQGGNENKAQGA